VGLVAMAHPVGGSAAVAIALEIASQGCFRSMRADMQSGTYGNLT
jgi:hypothetical protein